MFVEKIHSPADVKKLTPNERKILAQEIRDALLKRSSIHGGHFGPVFGVVEATIALHTVFDAPTDKLVWDISHQTYTHKILTGRNYGFIDPARYDEVSGYSSPAESEYDLFEVGHTSTSISLAVGLAKARDIMGGTENVVAFIGDGAMSGGEALEGLNVVGELNSNFIIIFNDNGMSIAENHGGMYPQFDELRKTNGKSPHNLFKAMGLDYMYVAEGNDIDALIEAFTSVKNINHPIVVHIHTEKGLGYKPAMEHKEDWHWHGPHDIETGKSPAMSEGYESYPEITGKYIMDWVQNDPQSLVVSSAVPAAMGLNAERRHALGKHYIDVGIAEETAVAVASGAAKRGAHVLYGTEATFLQRTYDQLLQDLATNHNPATILTFDASVWGMRDFTHIGFYDLAMMGNIPALRMLAPTTVEEFIAMLRWSLAQTDGPVIIRVPGGQVRHSAMPDKIRTDYSTNTSTVTHRGSRVAIFGLGSFYPLAVETARQLKDELGIDATIVNPQIASDIDTTLLDSLSNTHELIISLEDSIIEGGYGSKIATYLGRTSTKVAIYGITKDLYDRYNPTELMRTNRLDSTLIVQDVKQTLSL
ncbi:1-deoxy-D-xylulose-5-phosphate synthase [Alloscardovia venturai]|uniref:1-deoxy-D-xylulose-5-phosphate synthase n=1 Tax=Alloscardovia venturai TaxID=1769421 RepID=A0ABW2Y491_9BIFI